MLRGLWGCGVGWTVGWVGAWGEGSALSAQWVEGNEEKIDGDRKPVCLSGAI